MAIPAVPFHDPNQDPIDLPDVINPYLGIWWTARTVTGVPENVMGWLVAQGWRITAIVPDASTVPPTQYYSLAKSQLTPEEVLLSLCNSYTVAANNARDANELRYNQIVNNWQTMLSSTHTQFNAQITEQNASAGVYLSDLDTYMTEVDGLIDDNQAALQIEANIAKGELAAMLAKLLDLEINADATAALTEPLLTNQSGYTTQFLADMVPKLAELDTEYLNHLNEILNLIVRADNAHAVHEDLTRAFLDDLGATELARINEQFTSTLSAQVQDLVDKGLYSGALEVDLTQRNHRDRDEQIQMLNDRLMREKWENQHRIYGQLQDMIRWNTNTRDNLFAQLVQIAGLHLNYYEKKHDKWQDTSRAAVATRAALLAQLQDAVKGILAGKERYAVLTMNHGSVIADHKHRAIVEKMNKAVAQLEGWRNVAADNMKLLAYQLDERNKIILGLYSFVERREDIAPEWKDMASMIAGLADSAGGWISPS